MQLCKVDNNLAVFSGGYSVEVHPVDSTNELRVEAVDVVVTAVEKHLGNFEASYRFKVRLLQKLLKSQWINVREVPGM